MVRNKLAISKNYHIQPSEIDRLPFWEYEYYLDEINHDIEEEEERNKEEEKRYREQQQGFKMPDMQMPSFSMPSMPSF